MFKSRARGSTSNIGTVFLLDTASTTGGGKTGLTNASAGLNISVRREKDSVVTTYTGANISTITTLGTWADPTAGKVRFKEVDSTNQPGVYELQFVDSIFSTSDNSRTLVGMVTATGVAPCPFEIELTAADVQDGVHLGLTALPNVASGGAGAIPTTGTGANQISLSSGQVIIQAGTGAGQLDFTTGVVKSNMVQVLGGACPAVTVTGVPKVDVADWLGTAVTAATAGIPDVNTKNINNVAAATPGAAGGILISGANTGPMSISGGVTFSSTVGSALTLTSSGGAGHGLVCSGNSTGDGISATGGATGRGIHAIGGATSGAGFRAEGTAGNSNGFEGVGQGSADGLAATGGATGRGIHATGGATSGAGIRAEGAAGNSNGLEGVGQGSAAGISSTGGATGAGFSLVGGATSGAGLTVTTTSGDGFSITPTAGNGITATANGTSKHGIVSTGGTLGTSDGVKCVAGTGGVDLRANITGNVTGNVSGSVNSVTTGVTVAVNNDKTGYSLIQAFPANFSALAITVGGAVTVGTNNDKTGYTASTVTDKTGYSLSASGLNAITGDGGFTLVQMCQYIGAACTGLIADAGTGIEHYKGFDQVTTRLTCTIDASGNRSAVTYG